MAFWTSYSQFFCPLHIFLSLYILHPFSLHILLLLTAHHLPHLFPTSTSPPLAPYFHYHHHYYFFFLFTIFTWRHGNSHVYVLSGDSRGQPILSHSPFRPLMGQQRQTFLQSEDYFFSNYIHHWDKPEFLFFFFISYLLKFLCHQGNGIRFLGRIWLTCVCVCIHVPTSFCVTF